MPRTEKVDLKQELSQQADKLQTPSEENVKLKRNMSIPDMVKALTPELKKALPSGEVITIKMVVSPLKNSSKEPTGYIG